MLTHAVGQEDKKIKGLKCDDTLKFGTVIRREWRTKGLPTASYNTDT